MLNDILILLEFGIWFVLLFCIFSLCDVVAFFKCLHLYLRFVCFCTCILVVLVFSVNLCDCTTVSRLVARDSL